MKIALPVLGLVALLLPASALAQDAEESPAPAEPVFEREALDLDSDDGTLIIGKEHLPDFTVLIDREDLSKAYDLDLDERFLPKIIEAIGEDPF